MMKQLMIILGSAISIASPSQAQPLCHSILLNPPSAAQAETVLRELAKLKVELDHAHTNGSVGVATNILKNAFKDKLTEAQKSLDLDMLELKERLAKHIHDIQNKNVESKKESDHIREEQSLVKKAIAYQPQKRFEISELGPGVLSPNAQFLYLFETNNNMRVTAVNLQNGTRAHFPHKKSLVAKDRLFLQTDLGWKILDLNSGKVIKDNTDIPIGPFNSEAISADSKFLIGLTHDPQMKLATESQVAVYDLNGKSHSKLTIPVWPINEIPYFTDQYLVIKSMQNFFVYSFATKKADLLMLRTGPIVPVAGTNKILVREDGKTISLVDLDTLDIQSRQFNTIAQVFFAKDDRIMISERRGGPNAHFHLINTSNFLKSDESLMPRTEFHLHDIPGTDYVTVSNEYIQASEPSAIFYKHDLNSPLFAFNFSQEPGDPGQVHYQWVSIDGKKIISTVLHGRNSPTVDIWELKNEGTEE
jgi:hypothetical protein